MSSPWWQPANDVERAMSQAVADGDSTEFLRRFVSAELYLPQVPREGVVLREGAEEWVPLIRHVGGFPAIPVFTSLAGMGSAVVVGKYEVTGFAEVRDRWAEPDWWVAINPGLPIDASLPFDAVDRLISGDLVVVDGRLVRPDQLDAVEVPGAGGAEPGYDPDRVLNDPSYPGTRDQFLAALLDATVSVPTTRAVDDPDDLLEPDFPWLPSRTGPTPTIEVFTSADECARAYPDRPSVRVPFLLLMIAWPDGHALSVNPAGPVRMVCSADEVSILRQQAIAG
jgi:hypothetical protein